MNQVYTICGPANPAQYTSSALPPAYQAIYPHPEGRIAAESIVAPPIHGDDAPPSYEEATGIPI